MPHTATQLQCLTYKLQCKLVRTPPVVASRVQGATIRKEVAFMIADEYNAFMKSAVIAMQCYQGSQTKMYR